MSDLPLASVILIASDGPEPLGPILSRLRAQSIAHGLELVLAAPGDTKALERSLEASDFYRIRVVEADLSTSARARCAAIRAATAPIVILAEDHAFPVSDSWAADLIAALDGPFDAAGPVIENANPKTAISWAILAIEYGPWISGHRRYETDYIPGHNSAYRREVLFALDNHLESLMEAEYMLHRQMRADGRRLIVDPRIRVRHVNHSKIATATHIVYAGGKVFAAERAKDWSGLRRGAYAAAFPAIGLVRYARMLRDLASIDTRPGPPFRVVLGCAWLAAANALGEGMGYLFGAGRDRATYAQLEYGRWRHIQKGEMQTALTR
ncbi:MAG: glycosyltransferase [Pseudomonadota bacterium]